MRGYEAGLESNAEAQRRRGAEAHSSFCCAFAPLRLCIRSLFSIGGAGARGGVRLWSVPEPWREDWGRRGGDRSRAGSLRRCRLRMCLCCSPASCYSLRWMGEAPSGLEPSEVE